MILLLTPTKIEQKHIKPKVRGKSGEIIHNGSWLCKKVIGVGNGCSLSILNEKWDLVVLFGCCGGLNYHMDYRQLYFPVSVSKIRHKIILEKYRSGVNLFTSMKPIKTKVQMKNLADYDLVDMESFYVARRCQKIGHPLIIARYIIDFCDQKVKPTGINHFWRIYQHRKMQLYISTILRKKFFQYYGWVIDES